MASVILSQLKQLRKVGELATGSQSLRNLIDISETQILVCFQLKVQWPKKNWKIILIYSNNSTDCTRVLWNAPRVSLSFFIHKIR